MGTYTDKPVIGAVWRWYNIDSSNAVAQPYTRSSSHFKSSPRRRCSHADVSTGSDDHALIASGREGDAGILIGKHACGAGYDAVIGTATRQIAEPTSVPLEVAGAYNPRNRDSTANKKRRICGTPDVRSARCLSTHAKAVVVVSERAGDCGEARPRLGMCVARADTEAKPKSDASGTPQVHGLSLCSSLPDATQVHQIAPKFCVTSALRARHWFIGLASSRSALVRPCIS